MISITVRLPQLLLQAPDPLRYFGDVGVSTPTCAEHGFARATTYSGISSYGSPRLAFGAGTGWQDMMVAAIIAALAL